MNATFSRRSIRTHFFADACQSFVTQLPVHFENGKKNMAEHGKMKLGLSTRLRAGRMFGMFIKVKIY